MKHSAPELIQVEKAESSRSVDRHVGADVVVLALKSEGVKSVWGYPGGAVLPIYDAIHRSGEVEHLLVRHEQAALHAADGYARATGNVGVALVTSGPGITNAVTGVATAYFDSIPMVLISANVSSELMGKDAFQECDAVGITRSVVKHNFLVSDAQQLASTLKKAFHIARTGRPGPVHVDIPKDVLLAPAKLEYPESCLMRAYRPPTTGSTRQIEKAAVALVSAQRPFILVGGGAVAAGAQEEVARLASVLNSPVSTTLMALGLFPGSDERSVGMPGMHGTFAANMAMHHCDVIIAIGARFDDRVIGNVEDFRSTGKTVIQIDVDPSTIEKRVPVDIPIVGDARNVVRAILTELARSTRSSGRSNQSWWQQIYFWREQHSPLSYGVTEVIKPQFVIQKVWEVTNGQAYICSDVGQHQMFAAQHYSFNRPRRWINSGGLGTMGVGLPYAMGVKKAFPEADVVTITGDGSIQMCIQELATCKQYDLNLKIICLNNQYLGMVRQLQHVHYGDRYSNSYMDALPDFAGLAHAYGHVGLRVERPEDVEPAIRYAFAQKEKTVFLDIITDPEENVWPMIPGGKGLTQMLLRSEDLLAS
jgi:acetolactate synthase I/II/III large subunit